MTLTYDPQHNIAYIRLRESVEQVETIHVSEEMNVDLAPDGTIYGIELLNANQQLGSGELLVLNETSGARSSVKLPL
jgi:uncharacterized protein YuzE